MPEDKNLILKRKKEHLELCKTDEVSFKNKTNGFENYDFIHCAITEVDINNIDFSTSFLNKIISYPFIISCMTGGTNESENINLRLASVASELNIPIGIGSQRHSINNSSNNHSFQELRKKAKNIPILGNIGASQIVKIKEFNKILKLIDLVEADGMVVHLNPLQELLQPEGEPYFKGLLKSIYNLKHRLQIPLIIKEVGSGISFDSAKKLLECGVDAIDVAGAGGTSWAGVEILRNNNKKELQFWEWGMPTSYCIRNINFLKKDFNFSLIGSGGINNAFDNAKALALGADLTASARIILQALNESGTSGVINLIKDWHNTLKKIMFLTGSNTLQDLRHDKLIRKEELY
ncbi:MAG: type 2 isopentenyl-diphosphate Delta-isomerase [Ignavibacteriales bacterium CG_4_9_14_3_um_filter_30_11]|nr:MAG: type 2 isopentenyl-diphosphate Delta-isomerase [Ignavibacteriales bacterium CG_4_9_14_3_um_filter_30_11]